MALDTLPAVLKYRSTQVVLAIIISSGILVWSVDLSAAVVKEFRFDVKFFWAAGAALLALIVLFPAKAPEPLGAADRRGISPAYGGLALVGIGLALALVVVICVLVLTVSKADFEPDDLRSNTVLRIAEILAQLCIPLLGLLIYRAVLLGLTSGLRWMLSQGRPNAPALRFVTPFTVVFALVMAWAAGALWYALGREEWLDAALVFSPAVVGACYLRHISIKTILSHLGYFAVASIAVKESGWIYYGLLDEFEAAAQLDWTKNDGETIALILTVVGIALTLLLQLKNDLVSPPLDGAAPSSLSIYPDSTKYVGDDGHRDRLCRLILQSNGGVIGVTGLRGAGKSALLGAVMDRFGAERCVLWTVAPVSYQSADKLSFLMSISRSLCQKAIDDAGDVLYGRRGETRRAIEEFIRSIRVPLAVGCILVASVYLLGGASSRIRALSDVPLHMAQEVQIRDDQINFKERMDVLPAKSLPWAARMLQGVEASFNQARAAEVESLRALIARIDRTLRPAGDATVTEAERIRHAITPIPAAGGFDLISALGEGSDRSVLTDRASWLTVPLNIELYPNSSGPRLHASGVGVMIDDEFVSVEDGQSPFADYGSSFSIHYAAMYLHEFVLDEQHVAFIFLQEEFERRVVGNQKPLVDGFEFREKGESATVDFQHRLAALAALRGDPRLAPHLAAASANLRRILKTDAKGAKSQGLLSPDLASLVLIAAFWDAVGVLESQPEDSDKTALALDRLFLDAAQLRELRDVLARYVDVLEGGALQSAGAGGTDDATSVQSVTALAGALQNNGYAWAIIGLLIVCLMPELWRAGNFVARGLLNFRVLVLMRECTEFMELLNYSEGRQTTTGFGFRGLSMSGRRTLSARNLTLQSLTDRYQDFVSLLLTFYNGKLIVIIDELDKMSDPEQVKNVLLELKGALFQRGCYYLISISEDAAASFRGRLSEGRDIFESTFEDVLTIERMAPSTAREMVRKRLVDDGKSTVFISDAAIDVLTVLSSAIPREIVRHLREAVINADDSKGLEPRNIARGVFLSELRQWRESLKSAPFTGAEIIRLIEITEAIEASVPKQGDADWPEAADGRASAGMRLSECLSIMDPERAFVDDEVEQSFCGDSTAEDRRRFRRLAELQSCLRLMTMNEVMRRIWRENALGDAQAEAAITCLRAIMVQPAVAARFLEDLAVKTLGLTYPEDAASAPPPGPPGPGERPRDGA